MFQEAVVVEVVVALVGLTVLLAGYIAWRDRRRPRGPASRPFVEHGEGKSASYQANMHRDMGGGTGGGS